MNNILNTLLLFLAFHLIFLLSTKDVFAQEKNYLGYYHNIASAEEAIIHEKYEEALKLYQKAFDEYPYNNPVDCYVAAQIASYTEDTISCLRFIINGLCYGLPIETINGNPHLATIIKQISPSAVDSCWNIYRKSINTDARTKMISLIKQDQSIVHNLPKGESLYRQDGFTLKENYLPVWDSLINEVVTITNKYGFPAQKIIGTQNGEDSLFRIGPNAAFVAYIFIHHGNAWNRVSDILWTELQKGNITPQMYGIIYESSNGRHSYDVNHLYFASRPCQDKRCSNLIKDNLQEINDNRWKIRLGSYEVMKKKFESRTLYFKWRRKGAQKREPYFDFQCDINFQGK